MALLRIDLTIQTDTMTILLEWILKSKQQLKKAQQLLINHFDAYEFSGELALYVNNEMKIHDNKLISNLIQVTWKPQENTKENTKTKMLEISTFQQILIDFLTNKESHFGEIQIFHLQDEPQFA